jgi:hypothetical protein
MATNLTYQATYPAQPPLRPARAVDPNATLFASEDGTVASLSSQECIFRIKRSGDTHVMTFQVLQALDQCREFRSLDEHAARIESTIAGLSGKREDIRRVLEGLIQRGLLVSDENFIGRLSQAPTRVPAPLRGVFIRACDRPEQLTQLLASLAEYERTHRAGRRYVVIDDSSLPAHANEQRDLLREFARTTGCTVNYVGSSERGKLVERFAKALPNAKAMVAQLLLRDAKAAVERFGGGRSWNMAQLLSAGARMILLDDDLRFPLRCGDDARPGLDPDPNALVRAHFPASMEEALATGNACDGDPIELHLASCGQSLGTLVQGRYPIERTALRGLNLGRLDLLAADARIVATQCGSYGSTRTRTNHWMFHLLDGDSRAEFWSERASYQRNLEGQHLWYAVAQARTLAVSGFTPFALDNSALSPCTNPLGRGQDSLAGALIRFCDPQGLTLEMPEAIGHVQESARRRSEETLAVLELPVNYFLRDFVQRQFGLFTAADPAQRLRLLAEVMRDLAATRAADRIAHLREYTSYARADLIDRIQHRIEAATDAPVYWQADARTIVQANAKALLANAPPRLADWPMDIDDAGCAAALATELTQFADMCELWPTLWQHAAEQGEKLLSSV